MIEKKIVIRRLHDNNISVYLKHKCTFSSYEANLLFYDPDQNKNWTPPLSLPKALDTASSHFCHQAIIINPFPRATYELLRLKNYFYEIKYAIEFHVNRNSKIHIAISTCLIKDFAKA